MNLKEQTYIVTIAQCGNITHAAHKLGITQPALSSYLSNLESGLKTPLFERANKRLMPTYAGELYIDAARKMLSLKTEFDEKLSEITRDYRGRLRIGLQIRRSPIIIPSFYTAFRRIFPNVEVSFKEGVIQRLEDSLKNDALDLVLCNKTNLSGEFEYIHVADEYLLLATAKDHPLASTAQWISGSDYKWIDLRRFAGEMFFLQREDQSQRIISDRLLQQLDIVPGQVTLVQNIEASTRLASVGAGVSFVLNSYAKHFHFPNKPAYFLVGEPPVKMEYVACYRKGAYLPSYVDTAIEIIRNVL